MNTIVSQPTKMQKSTTGSTLGTQRPGSSRIIAVPTHAAIAARAYEIYIKKGRPQGQSEANWYQAEKELAKKA
jgi:hypothetical protein